MICIAGGDTHFFNEFLRGLLNLCFFYLLDFLNLIFFLFAVLGADGRFLFEASKRNSLRAKLEKTKERRKGEKRNKVGDCGGD